MQLVATLDHLRGLTYGTLLRVPLARAVVRRKDLRLAVLLGVAALPALFFAAFLPTFSLTAAPLVLGVPHLVADVRHLVLRPRWPAALLWLTGLGSAAVLGVRAYELSTGRELALLELGAAWLWCALAAYLGRRASRARLVAAALLLAALGSGALAAPEIARLVFGYAHNLVAIALWLTFFGGGGRPALCALAVVLAGALALLFGGSSFLPGTQALLSEPLAGLGGVFAPASEWFASPSVGAGLGLGVLSSFAFLQSIHYVLWLHVIPGQEVPGQRTRTFAQSWLALRADLGVPGLLLLGALTALTAAGLFVAPDRARTSYTSLSTFHGYLELAIGLYAWLAPRRQRS